MGCGRRGASVCAPSAAGTCRNARCPFLFPPTVTGPAATEDVGVALQEVKQPTFPQVDRQTLPLPSWQPVRNEITVVYLRLRPTKQLLHNLPVPFGRIQRRLVLGRPRPHGRRWRWPLVGGPINFKPRHHHRPHVDPGSGQRPRCARVPSSGTHPIRRVIQVPETLVRELNLVGLVAQQQTQVRKARLALRINECGSHLCLALPRDPIICIQEVRSGQSNAYAVTASR